MRGGFIRRFTEYLPNRFNRKCRRKLQRKKNQIKFLFIKNINTMRPLTETETQTLFTKLANYTGRSLTQLIAPPPSNSSSTPDRYVFRLHASRVYYMPESIANLATSIARPSLLSLGTCLGKFTKTGKFRLHITALDIIAPHARYKVWIKPNGEMPFLYGGNVVKAHIGRWSEDCPEHQGVVVYSMNDTPLVCNSNCNSVNYL